MTKQMYLRVGEMEDVPFLHKLFINPDIMDYWFDEPYRAMHHLEKDFKEKNNHSRVFIVTNARAGEDWSIRVLFH